MTTLRRSGSWKQIEGQGGHASWPPQGHYMVWHVLIGIVLGVVGDRVSLLANVVSAPWFGEHPLQLIRVNLTVPMGEAPLNVVVGVVLAKPSGMRLIESPARRQEDSFTSFCA